MPELTLSDPWMLIPALGVLVLMVVRRHKASTGSGLLRAGQWMLLAVALAGLTIGLPGPPVGRLALVDLSDSYRSRLPEVQRVLGQFDEVNRAVYVATEVHAGAYPPDGTTRRRFDTPGARSASRLHDALQLLGRLEAGPVDVLVFTDGRSTIPVSDAVLDDLPRRGIRLFPVPLPMPGPEVGLLGVDLPEGISPGTAFAVTARLRWSGQTTCMLKLDHDGSETARAIELPRVEPGTSRTTSVDLVTVMPGQGPARLTLSLHPTADHLAGNNRVQTIAWPAGARRVLVVAPEPLGGALVQTLSTLPATTAVASPPETAEVMLDEGPDVVVLAGTPLDRLPTELVVRLADEVNHRGTGLLALGGPRSFAIGGYIDTPVEDLLPVRCDPPGKRLALGLVLDASSSMASPPGGSRFDTARTAAVAVAGRLNRRDRLALVTFADRPTVLLRPRAEPSDRRVAEVLSQVKPYGATDLVAALERATELIRTVDLPNRHLLVLSDGRSSTTDIDTLLARLKQHRITVSVVASGDDHNRELLEKLTDATGGTFYRPRSIDRLQRTFLEDLRRRRGTLLDTRTIKAQVMPGPGRLASPLPSVTGLNPLDPRHDAAVWAGTEDGRPLLVVGPHGLGRSAALAIDPLAPGNRALWQSPRFVNLLADTLGWLSVRPTDSPWQVTLGRLDRGLSVTAHSPEPEGQPAALQAVVVDDSGPRTIELPPVAPGRYHAEVDHPAGTPVTVVVRRVGGPVLYRGALSATPPETSSWTVDHAELTRWAERTGGRVTEAYQPGEVLSSRHRATPYPLRAPALLVLVATLVTEAAAAWRRR